MKYFKYIFILIEILIFNSLVFGQHSKQEYIISQVEMPVKIFLKKYFIKEELLRTLNPKLKSDKIFKGDTIYLTAQPTISKINEELKGDTLLDTKDDGPVKVVEYHNKNYVVCEIDVKKYNIEFINLLQNNQQNTFSSIYAKRKNLIFVMNGGMFEPDNSPVGLFISDGKEYKPINLRNDLKGNFYEIQPNGVFLIDNNGLPNILTSELFVKLKPHAKMATQSGPMMIIDGKFNSFFDPKSINFNIRNGVGINGSNKIIFAISQEPVSFYEFADFFKTKMLCDNALYLDGKISQFYAPNFHKFPMQMAPLGVFIAISSLSTPVQQNGNFRSKKPFVIKKL